MSDTERSTLLILCVHGLHFAVLKPGFNVCVQSKQTQTVANALSSKDVKTLAIRVTAVICHIVSVTSERNKQSQESFFKPKASLSNNSELPTFSYIDFS